jgi:NADP-dependent 3-hydroxy acid dehydrogenase YdfG
MSKRAVVITGAGTGIGQAIAKAFAQQGASILAVGRSARTLEATAKVVGAAGAECAVHAADVSDARQSSGIVDAALKHLGGIDVLVNNAAQAVSASITDLGLAEFDAMLQTNAAGVLYMCRAVWPVMQKRGGGTIVNISSIAADDPFPGLAAYGATKAFVNTLTHGLAAEGRKDNIAVFAVAPGAVETQMLRGSFPDFPPEQTLPPGAIADMVVQLTHPICRYTTGETVRVRKS